MAVIVKTQVVAKAIHEGLQRNGTTVLYSAAFERVVADAINAHLSHVMQDTGRGLPPGYRVASRDGEYWPLHGDSYASGHAYPTRELAALRAWSQAYETLSSSMETIRRAVDKLPGEQT